MTRGVLMPLLMIGLGMAIVVRTLEAGGGPTAFGIVFGALFVLAGIGRLYIERRSRT